MLSVVAAAVKKTLIGLFRRAPLAGAVLERLLPAVPHSGAAARLYLWLAQARIDAGDDEAAIICCDRAVARHPALGSAYLCRGRLLHQRNDDRRAVEDLQHALRLLRPEGIGRPPRPGLREALACGHEALGQCLVSEGRPQEALEQLDAAIALWPERGSLYLWRAECHQCLGRSDLAGDDYRTAFAHGLEIGALPAALAAVARLEAAEGRVEAAAAKTYAAMALARRLEGEDDAEPPEAFALARIVHAYDVLAEDVVNRYGNLDAALEVYRAKMDLQRCLAASDPLGRAGVLVLPDDWVRNVGHMGSIDALLKMNHLGWRSWQHIVLLAPPQGTANRHYLNCLDGHVAVVTDLALCRTLAPLATAFGFRVAHALYPPGSALLYFFQAYGLIQQEWEAQGRPPLLAVSDADKEHGWRTLEGMGVPRDAWFVCLHVREASFHEAAGSRHQAHRNGAIADYLPAIREITRRGGWVVRMGDRGMTPLPGMERVIDYAHSPAKSQALDVFLCGQCRFFIGLASGLSQLALGFGVPCVYVNWISNVLPPFSAKDVFIPKLFRVRADGRLLSFDEMFDPQYLYLNASYYRIGQRGLEFLDSEPADIRDAVAEMLDQLDGDCVYTAEDLRARERLDTVLTGWGHRGYCRMGKAFVRKYGRLLPCREDVAPRAAG